MLGSFASLEDGIRCVCGGEGKEAVVRVKAPVPLTRSKKSPNFMVLCKLGNYNEQRRQRGWLFEGRSSRQDYWRPDHRVPTPPRPRLHKSTAHFIRILGGKGKEMRE